jgi:hypothetical protein
MSEVVRLTQEAQLLIQLVNRAAANRQYGSFAARNPLLGKMFTCPYCRRRERRGEHRCTVNINHPVTAGKSLVAKRRIVPRLTRKRPPLFLVHQILVEIEDGRRSYPRPVPKENLAKYVEAVVTREKKERAHEKRDEQKLSRRINWGLA